MNTFYFDTGVKLYGHSNPPMRLSEGQVWRNGTKQIPFDADAPKDSMLLFACDDPNHPEKKIPGVIVCEISNTSLLSKYAYMRTPLKSVTATV